MFGVLAVEPFRAPIAVRLRTGELIKSFLVFKKSTSDNESEAKSGILLVAAFRAPTSVRLRQECGIMNQSPELF